MLVWSMAKSVWKRLQLKRLNKILLFGSLFFVFGGMYFFWQGYVNAGTLFASVATVLTPAEGLIRMKQDRARLQQRSQKSKSETPPVVPEAL